MNKTTTKSYSMSNQGQHIGQAISRTRFSMVPIELAEACADHKSWLFVYIWLWHYAGKDDQAFPSVDRLAAECHMAIRDVRSALTWLTNNGWIKRIERPGRTSLFYVRTEKGGSKRTSRKGSQQTPPPNGGVPKKERGQAPTPTPKRPGVRGLTPPPNGLPLPHMGDTPFGTPNKKEEINPTAKKPSTSSLRSEVAPPFGGIAQVSQETSTDQQRKQQPDPSTALNSSPEASRSLRKAPQPALAATDTSTPSGEASQARGEAKPQKSLLPDFAEPVRELLEDWWRLRRKRHRASASQTLSPLSIKALAYANGQGVLHQFAEHAAEHGWLSLGFNGHRDYINKLVADLTVSPGSRHSGSCMLSGRSASAGTSKQSAAVDLAIAMFTHPDVDQLPVASCSPILISSMPLAA